MLRLFSPQDHDISVDGELESRATSVTQTKLFIDSEGGPTIAIIVAELNVPNRWDDSVHDVWCRKIEALPEMIDLLKYAAETIRGYSHDAVNLCRIDNLLTTIGE